MVALGAILYVRRRRLERGICCTVFTCDWAEGKTCDDRSAGRFNLRHCLIVFLVSDLSYDLCFILSFRNGSEIIKCLLESIQEVVKDDLMRARQLKVHFELMLQRLHMRLQVVKVKLALLHAALLNLLLEGEESVM